MASLKVRTALIGEGTLSDQSTSGKKSMDKSRVLFVRKLTRFQYN